MDTSSNPLYAHQGIIYLIRNRVNGKCYVGQTLYSFARRYHGLNWWRYSNNPYLKAAQAKYGTDAFEIVILEHSKTLPELNELEAQHALLHSAYVPHGYNLIECGDNRRQHPCSILKRSRTVTLNSPEGVDVQVTNIRAFCRNHGLDGRAIARVLSGEHATHRGWSKGGETAKHHRNNRQYTLYDRAGQQHDTTGLTAFCREKGLDYHSMRSMTQGKIAQSQGFALSVGAFSRGRKRHVVTLTNGGQEIVLRSVKRDAPAHGLAARYVYQLVSGKLASYKGWTLKQVAEEPVQAGRASEGIDLNDV